MTPEIQADVFNFRWRVDLAGYEWKKGFDSELHLVVRNVPGSSLKNYLPLENKGLFLEFSALRGKDEILEFAQQYGNLFDTWSGKGMVPGEGTVEQTAGTSLKGWKQEVEYMHLLVNIWESIADHKIEELDGLILWEDKGVCYEIRTPEGKHQAWLMHSDFGPTLPIKRGDILLPAQYALQREINKRLEAPKIQSVPRLTWTPDYKQRITITPPNLLAGMWLQFAQAVTGEYQLKRCQECEKYFQVGPGGRRADAVTCSDRCRQRRSRKLTPKVT